MPHGLPVADSTRLDRSPLQLVVCQIKFEQTVAVGDPRLILALHEELGGADGPYPKVEQVRGSRLDIPVNLGGQSPGVPSETSFTAWRMQHADGWMVTVMPDSVSLETTRYTAWTSDFKPRLTALVDATAKHIKPATEQRVGLRYVDRIVEPPVTEPDQWRGLIADEALGALLHPTLGPLVRAIQQQLILDLGDGISAIVRTAMVADPAASDNLAYMLDIDVFREGVRAFDSASIKGAVVNLHDINLRLFQQVTSADLRRQLTAAEARADGR